MAPDPLVAPPLRPDSEPVQSALVSAAEHTWLSVWSLRWIVDDAGTPIRFDDRPWLKELYDDTSPHIIVEKANQLGATIWAVSDMLHAAVTRGHHSLYYFPVLGDALNFSKARGARIMRNCEPVAALMEQGRKRSKAIEGAPATGVMLKQVGLADLYFAGLGGRLSTEQVAANRVYFDERDFAPADKVRDAMTRLMGQKRGNRVIRELSIPSVPAHGIDEAFLGTDQKFWHVNCRCPDGIALELAWPACVAQGRLNGYQAWYRCPTCGTEPLDPRKGRWVRHGPEQAAASGYHLSQTASPVRSAADLWHDWTTTWAQQPEKFYRRILGLPYRTKDAVPNDDSDWQTAQSYGAAIKWVHELRQEDMGGRSYVVGIDVMERDCYCVAKQRGPSGRLLLVGLHVAQGSDPLESAMRWAQQFPNVQIAIDARGGGAQTRRVAMANRGTVGLVEYTSADKLVELVPPRRDPVRGTDEPAKYKVNRSQGLEWAGRRTKDGLDWHPDSKRAPRQTVWDPEAGKMVEWNLYALYCRHRMGVVKREERTDDDRVTISYADLNSKMDPHFVHANLYAEVAAYRRGGSGSPLALRAPW